MSDQQEYEFLTLIREGSDAADTCHFYMGRGVVGLKGLGLSGKEITDKVLEETKVKLTPWKISRLMAYAKLPDSDATKLLTLTRVYSMKNADLPDDWEQKALDAADITTAYTWAAFDADVLGKLPPDEKPWRPCPVDSRPCGRIAKEDS